MYQKTPSDWAAARLIEMTASVMISCLATGILSSEISSDGTPDIVDLDE